MRFASARPVRQQQLRLRRPEQCRVCSIELPGGHHGDLEPGSENRDVPGCNAPEVATDVSTPIDPDVAGASALRKHRRLHDARPPRPRHRREGQDLAILYCTGIGLSFADRWLALAVYVGVALMWLVPDRRAERQVSTVPAKPGSRGNSYARTGQAEPSWRIAAVLNAAQP
ncbi:MAG: hypothetical protein WAU75_15770 [Solirubrobacteraceae bacterium]